MKVTHEDGGILHAALKLLWVACAIIAAGCDRGGTDGVKVAPPPSNSVVLYTSVDEPYARPLVDQFKKQAGIKVTLVTDAEASKSVGLAKKLRAEKDHPAADVWWSNECFLTIGLADDGVLAPKTMPAAIRSATAIMEGR